MAVPPCLKEREASTRLVVLQRGRYSGQPATKLLLYPTTGRRHQLRVHCHHLGHTIVGDYTYSSRHDLLPPRMFLHAARLVLDTRLEQLDICTGDPFTPEDEARDWEVEEELCSLQQGMALCQDPATSWPVLQSDQ